MSEPDPTADGADSPFAPALLAPVMHGATGAILVVDLRTHQVTYANDLAHELAPDCPLPVSVDEWSAAAGLEDAYGTDLPPGGNEGADQASAPMSSLLRVAQGEPVTGEAVTAARATAVTRSREPLWVLGLPLTGAADDLASLVFVVFLPARNAVMISGAQESAISLRDRAMAATPVSFTITDPAQHDAPLVWVNRAFTATTGYEAEDAVGRNCRFLQGPDTDREVVAEIRRNLGEGRPFTSTLLNYRKDGSTFWNELSISPVRDGQGTITHFVGVQADVTERVTAQQARDEALAQVAEAAERIALLADFSARLASSQQPERIIEMLASVLVPRIATWSAIYTYDEQGHLAVPHLRHERGADADIADRLRGWLTESPGLLSTNGPVLQVLNGAATQVVLPNTSLAEIEGAGVAAPARELVQALGTSSLIVMPLRARRGVGGCIVVGAAEDRPAFDGSAVALVRDLAMRSGLMLENSQLYTRERATATTLQLSLLPQLPRIDGVEIAASYVPAVDEAAVGGDWYDVFRLRSGGIGVVVGDVMGHDYDSAARMGKLSTIVRSYAWRGGPPSEVLGEVDELLASGDLQILATCMLGRLTLHEGGATLSYSSAGHPPAIVRRADGQAHSLDDGRGPMIGVSELLPSGTARPGDAQVEIERGGTLLCFTDGLTDAFSPEPDMTLGMVELLKLTSALPAEASPEMIVDVLTGAATRHSDDVAVIAIRIL